MGLQIGDIVPRKSLEFSDLKGKVVAVDAFNAIYQFLSSIRQPDGTPLMDNEKRVTSHLSGLFYRNIALLSEGMKLIYVFDGESPELKNRMKEERRERKAEARDKYEAARDEEDIDSMGKYGKQIGTLDSEKIEESKELLEAMGVAVVQAPGEGEMQAAQLVKDGEAYAVASQDYDALVVGADRLIQNLTLARKRRLGNGTYVFISPELIEYKKTLQSLQLDTDQLISLAILVGSDFNPKGVHGIGPKKALSLVKEKKFPAVIFKELEEQGKLNFNWKDVFEIFKKPDVKKEKIVFPKMNIEKIKEILVERHDFSLERVEKQLEKLNVIKGKNQQQTLF
ncbi:flap endonuclease-1 [Candidatus Pacearchaeota archaeon]|nr:flap endonuclease-1 [Candidatus Pacearchaeota archaeon]|tara:strand:+ start:768 stop:1784 length:1017 start_codon:yes stop_codon:yes gene_type:complete